MIRGDVRNVVLSSCLVCSLIVTVCRLNADGSLAPPLFPPETPHARGLDSNLYMQTSAEYRAACFQAYNLAEMKLKQHLGNRGDRKKDPAVIMDLDETVFDNAGYQASQLRSGLGYDQRLWDLWESNHSEHIGLIPGAKGFVLSARKNGVTVVFVSNRSTKYAKQAKDALTRLGIAIENDSLVKLSNGDNNKTSRFEEVEKAYDVLLYIGDNLRDFSERFKCPDLGDKSPQALEQAIQARKTQVDETEKNWADRWIIVPNSAYGEWTKPLGQGDRDYDRLVKPVN